MSKLRNILVGLFIAIIVTTICIPAYAAPNGHWVSSGSRWWYSYSGGSYARNKWEKISGYWYHFDYDGWMETGWKYINGDWYYLNPDGDMATGWKYVNGKWYYMKSNGAMETGWKYVNENWYYLKKDGTMLKGLRWIEDGMYLLGDSGNMLTGKQSVAGKELEFDSSGRLIGGGKALTGLCLEQDGIWKKIPEHFQVEHIEGGSESDLVYGKYYNEWMTSDRIITDYKRHEAYLYRNEIRYESFLKIDFENVKKQEKLLEETLDPFWYQKEYKLIINYKGEATPVAVYTKKVNLDPSAKLEQAVFDLQTGKEITSEINFEDMI